MPAALPREAIYRRRRFSAEVIELCVRWYLTYRLSYRDLSAMMAERDVAVSPTTILRWLLRYVPEYEKRWARFARPIRSSWRMDETAVRVRGRWNYLYRAVDRDGKSVHSLLSVDRSIGSAQEFFRQAIRVTGSWPEKINLDGNAASHRRQGAAPNIRRTGLSRGAPHSNRLFARYLLPAIDRGCVKTEQL